MTAEEYQLSVSRKLAKHVHALAENGSLQKRAIVGRKPCWVLRFRSRCLETGKWRQHSISLGDSQELHDLVVDILDTRNSIRAEHREKFEAEKNRRRRRREMTKTLLEQVKGSNRYRKTVARAFRDYCDRTANPSIAQFMPLLEKPPLKRQKRGRPFRRRLW